MDYLNLYLEQLQDVSDELFFKRVITSFYYSYSHNHTACIKNTNSHYAAVSPQFAMLVGSSPKELIGKTDFQIIDDISKLAQIFYQQDREVETYRECRKYLDINYYASGLGMYIFRKSPIINPATNNVLGTYCVVSEFKGKSPLKMLKRFHRECCPHESLTGNSIIFTKREKEVLFCLGNGLTDRKLIATFLSTIHGKEIGADATIKKILKSLYLKLPGINNIPSLADYAILRNHHREIPDTLIFADNVIKGISIPYE